MITRHNLDFMRAIAVTTVLIDHTTASAGVKFFHGWELGWLGIFGVYLFFVHTCLVLMWSLERRPHTLDFYTRRAFRIYPLAMLMVVIVAVLHLDSLHTGHPLTGGMFLSNLLLIQKVWVKPNVNGVLWSLPLELDMYLLLPMLFLFARRERTIWPFLIFWAFACVAADASYGHVYGNGLYAVIPHFLPGVIAYIGFKRLPATWPAPLFAVSLAALCAFFMLNPGVRRGWVVCLILGLILPRFRDFKPGLVGHLSHYIAQYSYGIYLLHPIALLVGFKFFHHLSVSLGVAAALTAAFSITAYHFVEHPMMRVGSRMANHLQQRFGTNYSADYGLDLA